MKTRSLIIIGIVLASVVLVSSVYAISVQDRCESLLGNTHYPRPLTLWNCIDYLRMAEENPQPQRVISDPICFITDRSSSGETGSAVTLDRCIALSEFEDMGCTKPMLEHLYQHSNLLDYEYDGTWYLEFVGLPDGMLQEKFDECVDAILEKRPILKSHPPEPGPWISDEAFISEYPQIPQNDMFCWTQWYFEDTVVNESELIASIQKTISGFGTDLDIPDREISIKHNNEEIIISVAGRWTKDKTQHAELTTIITPYLKDAQIIRDDVVMCT